MKRIVCLMALVVAGIVSAEVRAGGPPPVCMAVQKLVFEPSESTPSRVQIWGTFAFLNDTKEAYGEPVRGYLYYAAAPGKEEECRKEWAKLKQLVAGQHLISWGLCGEPKVDGDLRKSTAKAEDAMVFPLVKQGFANADSMQSHYHSLKQLRASSAGQAGSQGK